MKTQSLLQIIQLAPKRSHLRKTNQLLEITENKGKNYLLSHLPQAGRHFGEDSLRKKRQSREKKKKESMPKQLKIYRKLAMREELRKKINLCRKLKLIR